MVQNPPQGTPRISPYLYYENAAAALAWLTRAFGFRERFRMEAPGGGVNHAELEMGDGLVMIGQPGGDYQSPKRSGRVSQLIYVYVDDVDAHCERARAAGAAILSGPEDVFYGDRRYAVEDLEGHHWNFAQHTRDVAPEDMHPPA